MLLWRILSLRAGRRAPPSDLDAGSASPPADAADGASRPTILGSDAGSPAFGCRSESDYKCVCSPKTTGDAGCDEDTFSSRDGGNLNGLCCAAADGVCTCVDWGCTAPTATNGSCSCGIKTSGNAANLTEMSCYPPGPGKCCRVSSTFCECRPDGLCPSGTPVAVCDTLECPSGQTETSSCEGPVTGGGGQGSGGGGSTCTEPGWASSSNPFAPHGSPNVPPACSQTSDCCEQSLCVSGILSPETQGYCVARCAKASDCSTGCCAPTSGGEQVCVGPSFCQ